MLGTAGLIAFLLGGLGMGWLAIRWSLSRLIEGWTPVNLHQTAALFYCLGLFIIGAVSVGRSAGRNDRRPLGARHGYVLDC